MEKTLLGTVFEVPSYRKQQRIWPFYDSYDLNGRNPCRCVNSLVNHSVSSLVQLTTCILVGVQTDEVIGANNKLLLDTIDALILAAFTAEMLIKVVQEGFYPWRFFLGSSHNLVNSRDIVRAVQWWNLFDFLIIGGNFIFRSSVNDGGEQLLSMMRLVRLLRVLKVVRAFPELQVIVEALITGLRSIAYIGKIYKDVA